MYSFAVSAELTGAGLKKFANIIFGNRQTYSNVKLEKKSTITGL